MMVSYDLNYQKLSSFLIIEKVISCQWVYQIQVMWIGELHIIMQSANLPYKKGQKKNMVLVSLMATSFSVVNWLSSPSINKVDTYIHRQELKLLKQGDKFFPYLSLGLFSSLISRLWNPFLFIWVFFCKFAFRAERIKRKERKTSYSAVFLFLEINGWNTQN